MGWGGRGPLTKSQVMAWKTGGHVDRGSGQEKQPQETLGAGGHSGHGGGREGEGKGPTWPERKTASADVGPSVRCSWAPLLRALHARLGARLLLKRQHRVARSRLDGRAGQSGCSRKGARQAV